MENKRQTHQIIIKNADIWTAGWITYYMYKFVDEGEIESVKVEQVRKSEESIDLIIVFLVAKQIYDGVKDVWEVRKAIMKIEEKVKEMLRMWKERKAQTKLEMFFDNERI